MKKSKAILMVVCAMLLVAASVMGTLAYLTSTAAVTNTFSVGNVAISMDEFDYDNDNNTADNVVIGNETRDTANAYKLMPGHEYRKDPIVRVATGSEDCYLFVKVANEIAAIEEKGTTESPATTTVAKQMEANGWEAVENQTGVYVYTNKTAKPVAVAGGTNVPVFEKFVIDDDVINSTLANYDAKTIVVTAYAIQADGFENTSAADMWAEFGVA